MKSAFVCVAVAMTLPLAACDKPKSRTQAQASPPVVAAAPQPAPAVMPTPGEPPKEPISGPATKKPGMSGFYVDFINTAQDPLNKQPAVVSAADPITIGGFAFDAAGKVPGKGVDLVIDGKAYGAAYGAARNDVAGYYKTDKLTNVGFKVTFPAQAIAKGDHTLVVRVVSPDGQSYQDSAVVKFSVQ